MDDQQDDSNSQTELKIDTDAVNLISDDDEMSPDHEIESRLTLNEQGHILTPSSESDNNYELVLRDDAEKNSECDTLEELEDEKTIVENEGTGRYDDRQIDTESEENCNPVTAGLTIDLTDSCDDTTRDGDRARYDKTADSTDVKSSPLSEDYELSVQSNEEHRGGLIEISDEPTAASEVTDLDDEQSDNEESGLVEEGEPEESDSFENKLADDSGDDESEPEKVDDVNSEAAEQPNNDQDFSDDDLRIQEDEKPEPAQLSDDDFAEECENVPHETSDDGSDFAGFDSFSTEKTAEMIEILYRKQEELTQLREKTNRDNVDAAVTHDSVFEEDEAQINSDNSGKPETSVVVKPESNSLVIEPPHQVVSPTINIESATTSVAQKPIVTARRPLPVMGPHINIFEEQVPSGSKRVKKKRKFFGDFIESDGDKSVKKPNVDKLPESSPKILNNISSENKENYMTDDKMTAEALSENETTATSQATPTSQGQIKAKRSSVFDISNPLYKEPFKYGWKREICYRNLPEGSKGKTAYVTYFSPQGKKFKSIRQIGEHLPSGSELSMLNFTFSKERIFTEHSECEILRHNKNLQKDLVGSDTLNNSEISSTFNESTSLLDESQPKSASKKKSIPSRVAIKKPKVFSKIMDSDDEGTMESSLLLASVPSSTTPKIVIKNTALNSSKSGSSKSKSSNSKKDKRPVSSSSKKSSDKSRRKPELNAQSASSMADSSVSDYSPTMVPKTQRTSQTCSLSCPLALGSFPTLQCTVCLSLYHFECCGVDSSFPVYSYVCKTCRCKSEVSSKLLLAVSSESSHAFCNNVEYSRAAAAAVAVAAAVPPKNAKIVDGVTTWLPSSSNVRLSSRHAAAQSASSTLAPDVQAPLLQSVLELDGRRYIIVPKESIVSISPNTNAAVNTTYSGYGGRGDSVPPLESSPPSAVALPQLQPPPPPPPQTFLMNSSNSVNSDGVLLVPVMPPASAVASPQHLYPDIYNHIGAARAGKRKHSNESDSSLPLYAKMARLDADSDGWRQQQQRSALTLANVTQLYDALTLCFKYLTVRDLLRVSMSCKYLNRIASEASLWSTVRLKNSRVRDWEGFAKALRKHGTKKLDLRKMLCSPSLEDAMWDSFVEVIPTITSLEHIEFSRCSSSVVEMVAETCPNLAVINAVQLKNGISFESFTKSKRLRELRLKGLNKLMVEPCDDGELESELEKELEFASKDELQVLSITSVKKWDPTAVQALADLRNLRILELGECSGVSVAHLSYSLARLERLERLRLEQIVNLDPEFELFAALKTLKHFRTLELINVDVKQGFDKAIAACQNIEELLIIPLYKAEAVTTNRVVMDSLQSLSQTLKTFVWCLTAELVTATHLYAERYDEKSEGAAKTAKKPNIDSIPILKSITKANEVEILSIRNLEKILALLLPHARNKVLKVPFNSTWRQSLSECFK